MSMNALILGTIQHLRSLKSAGGPTLDSRICDEQADGQPPPNAGQVYYAVHDEGSKNSADESLQEEFDIAVTITLRTPYTPKDRENQTVRQEIRRRAEEVKYAIHCQKEPTTNANAILGASRQYFAEPLRYRTTSKIEAKGPDWFWADGDDTAVHAGVAITVRFTGALLVEAIDDS